MLILVVLWEIESEMILFASLLAFLFALNLTT